MVAGAAPSPPARGGTPRAAVLLAGLVALVFWDVLLGGRTLSPAAWVPGVLPSGPVGAPPPPPPAMRDLEGGAWVDEPAPYLVHRPLARLDAPLWNPRAGLGAPLGANPNMAAWSPLQLPTNLWPSPLVQDLTWVLRVYLLALSTWLLARALGFGMLPAIAAAAALALSGQTIDWLVHHPLNTDVFVPVALAAALGVLRGRRGAAAGLALAVAAALLGVKPQSALTGALFGLVVMAAVLRDDAALRRGGALARVGTLVVAVALGTVIAGVALVPFLESLDAASGLVRAGRGTQAEWTLPLRSAAGLAGPWALRLVAGDGVAPLSGPPHAGVAVLALALVGLWRARRRALAWVLAATAALYLTRIFGLLPVPLGGVPLVGSISFVKYCFPLYAALALLAGLALEPVPHGGARGRAIARSGGAIAVLGLLAIVLELFWLTMRPRPLRIDPYAPAPYVTALHALAAESPGRISGPVDLLPPLVSAVLGFRDLRAIDVLTPRDGYDFVSQVVAPSQGLTWILADPDPLVAATAPGADAADLRWILARGDLAAEQLPAAVRSLGPARRLLRLFATLDAHRIETAALGGGITERDGDRRFHWICTTPCRFEFALDAAPRWFAAGIATPEPASLTVATVLRAGALERRARTVVTGHGGSPWHDVWLEGAADAPAGGAVVEIEIEAGQPTSVLVGGIGPTPGAAYEEAEARDELAFRRAALARLRLRHRDGTARVFENPGALGDAYLATAVLAASGMDEVRACLAARPGEAVACVPDPGLVPTAPPDRPPGAVRVTLAGDARLEVEVSAARDALLVVSRLDAPGWRATVDATEVPITRVHGAMMGIVVPRGDHRVVVEYRPRSMLLGAALSFLGLVGLVIWMRRFEGHQRRR